MKKSVSIIAAAAMAASLSIAGSMTSFAAEEAAAEPTAVAAEATEAVTIAPTEAAVAEAPTAAAEAPTAVAEAPTAAAAEPTKAAATVDVQQFAGNWKLQVANNGSTVDVDAKDNGTVVITSDGKFTYTDLTGNTVAGAIELGTEEIAGNTLQTVRLTVGGELLYGGYYNASSGVINIGNGGQARLIRDNAAPAVTTAAATSAATTAAAATTAKPAAATTKAATTAANSGSKTDSPKTGVAFPAAALTGLTAAAASAAFVLRKRED